MLQDSGCPWESDMLGSGALREQEDAHGSYPISR